MSGDSAELPVLLEVDGAIATIALNRPAAGNTIDLPMARALVAAVTRCDADPAIRCVVLTGNGKLFCGGGDVKSFAAAGDDAPALLSELAGTLHMAVARFARMAKPLVCLVNGPAAGAGFGLALCGDLVLCADAASFTPAYGAVGLTPDGGLSWLLPRLVGLRRAQEIILLNQRVDAADAVAMGIVTSCVALNDLAAQGRELAEKLAAASSVALAGAKTLLLEGADSPLELQLEREARSIAAAGGTVDGKEGVAAFLARRAPVFKTD